MRDPINPAESGASAGRRAIFIAIFPSIMLPMFLAVMDQTIVATALPAIAASLGGVERLSWVVVSYLVAGTIAAPVYGQLGDTFGRRRLLLLSLATFIIASALCAGAPSIEVLALARVLQGLGGGGLMTLSQALIGETVPPRERGRYQGYLASVVVCANTFGPIVGGYLAEHFGWPSIFLINVPFGVIAFLLALRLDVRPGLAAAARFDFPGLLYFVMFVAPLLFALEQIQQMDERAVPLAAGLAAVGLIALGLLLRQERRSPAPLLPIALLRQPAIWRSDALAACHGAALVSLITFLPIYLRVGRGMSAAATGAVLVPLMVGVGVGSMITGRIVSRTGRLSALPFYGLIVVTLNLLLLGAFAPKLATSALPWILLWNGLFMGTVMGVVQVTVQNVAGPALLGAAAASVQFSRSVGAAFGTAIVIGVLFAVLAATDREAARVFGDVIQQGRAVATTLSPARQAAIIVEITDAFRAGFLTIGAFTLLGLVLAWSSPARRI